MRPSPTKADNSTKKTWEGKDLFFDFILRKLATILRFQENILPRFNGFEIKSGLRSLDFFQWTPNEIRAMIVFEGRPINLW
jgi:hypothetical protein